MSLQPAPTIDGGHGRVVARVMDETGDVRLAVAGDDQAFMRLVRAYQTRVRGLARWLIGDRDLAEDVAQEVFVRAWRALPRYRDQGAFGAWLFGITRNTAMEVRRKERVTVHLDQAGELADARVPDLDLRHDLQVALGALDDAHREVFLLVVLVGCTYEETGAIVGCPRGTVASRVARARARLSDALVGGEVG